MAEGFPSLSSADSLHGGSRETLLFDNPAYLYTVTRPHARDGRDYFLYILVAAALLWCYDDNGVYAPVLLSANHWRQLYGPCLI